MTVEYIRKQNHDSADIFFFQNRIIAYQQGTFGQAYSCTDGGWGGHITPIYVYIYMYDTSVKLLKDRYVYEHRDTLKTVESES